MQAGFWEGNADWVGAAITIAIAVLIAYLVDRVVLARGARAAARVSDIAASRAAQTRLRVVRRLISVVIIVVGIGLALGEFTELNRLATGLLASSAVLGIIVGLAARHVLANPLAGVLLAFTQPFRIGDSITIQGETGRVEDITLSYTYIDTGDGRLMVLPNEAVIQSTVFNRSTGDRGAPATVSVWLPPDADVGAARRVLEGSGAARVELAEITPDGLRLVVQGPSDPSRTVVEGEEAALRERAHEALREAGLLARGEN